MFPPRFIQLRGQKERGGHADEYLLVRRDERGGKTN